MSKLGDWILDSASGPFGSNLKVECFVEKGFPIIDGANMKGVALTDNITKFVTEEKARSLSRSIAKRHDIVVTISGTLGQVVYIPLDSEYEEYLCSQRQFRVTFDETKVDVEYLAYYLHTSEGQKKILAFANYVGVPALSQPLPNFKGIEVDFPSVDEQHRRIALIKQIEEKISNNNAICSDLEAMAKLLYDYWFVQFDFPNDEGKPYKSAGGEMVWSEELKREIPKGWKCVTYSNCISSINTGLNPRDHFKLNIGGKIKYLTVKNLTTEGTIDFSSCDCIDEAARDIVHKRSDIQIGDILFASISPLGRCYIISEKPKDWDINESVFSIRPNKENMTSSYLYFTFTSNSFIRLAEGNSTGSVFKGIRITELSNLKTILPPKKVLDAFDNKVKGLLELKVNSVNESQQLASLRDFLLPMLMNGQVKVTA
jgi:type I restriction enzyme S subunit